jgi:perosamine synthetase
MNAPHKVTLSLPSDQDFTGRSLGEEEIALVSEALRSGTLTSTKGQFTKTLEESYAKLVGASHAYACSSGTSAIHAAISAVDPEPGDEIICSPITDMGALTPVLYQAAIPVFADVCPKSLNLTANTIYKALSSKTKAIVVTHLFGNPANMAAISQLAKERNIPLIEDCAQAFLAKHQGKYVGTWGDIGCFSLQQGKHITTGEGGLVVSNNPEFARRMFLFINKAWGYGDAKPDHYFIALNSRMSELQGAVAVAQLEKLGDVTAHRMAMADRLTKHLAEVPGIATPQIREGDVHSFWKYCLTVDPAVIPGGSVALGARLKTLGVLNAPRYIVKPAFRCEIFRDQRTFGNSRFPFTLARPEAVDYSAEKFPGTFTGLENVLVLPWNEKYQTEHVDFVADQIRSAVADLIETQETTS